MSRLNDESLLNDSANTETKSAYFMSETEENSNIVSNTDTLESIEETRKRKSGGRLKYVHLLTRFEIFFRFNITTYLFVY